MTKNAALLIDVDVTTSGSSVLRGELGQDATLFWTIGSVTGTNAVLTFTMQEVDPSGESIPNGKYVVSSPVIEAGSDLMTLRLTDSPTILISWTVTGISASFNNTYLTAVSKIVGNAIAGVETSGYTPEPSSVLGASKSILRDPTGNLSTRGQVLTDEGSFRDDFSGTYLTSSLTGTCTFTNGSDIVTGFGTLFSEELNTNQHIMLSTDDTNHLARIDEIISDNRLILSEPYIGSGGSGDGKKSNWHLSSSVDSSYTISNSNLELTTTTNSDSLIGIYRFGDYLPFTMNAVFNISQRIANQEIVIGFQDSFNNPKSQAVFVFSGSDNTSVKCLSSFNTDSVEETLTVIPAGITTTVDNVYKIEHDTNKLVFTINNVQVAEHYTHLSDPYKPMDQIAYIKNTGTTASPTTLNINTIHFSNFNNLNVSQPIKIEGTPNGLPLTVAFGIAGGAPALPKLININYNKSDGAIIANAYKRVATYTVPTGYNAYLVKFVSYQNETASSRVVAQTSLATFDNNTPLFTADIGYPTPAWAAAVQAHVTTAFAAGAGSVILTVTYTNESGTTGRTGTITVAKGSAIGSRFDLVLQAGDLGVSSIQNITTDTVQVGIVEVYGLVQLALHLDQSTTTQTETLYAPGSITFGAGTIVGVEYAGGTVSKQRILDVLIQLLIQTT